MQTSLDCLVCFMRQALNAARLSTDDPSLHRQVIDKAGQMLSQVDLSKTPPENAVYLYRLIAEISGNRDPFAGLKKQSNEFALSIRELIRKKIRCAEDPLRTAIRFAICGNIIDYAAQHSFDAAESMADCEQQSFVVDDYSELRKKLTLPGQVTLLYLADNCGEIVFDGLLIDELQKLGCTVTLAVRGASIINDATLEDVHACGLESLCAVIDNGTDCPGTPMNDCSDHFLQAFAGADIILSKGMGNFETLSEISAPIFFLFTVKCSRVAMHLHTITGKSENQFPGTGEMVLMQQR